MLVFCLVLVLLLATIGLKADGTVWMTGNKEIITTGTGTNINNVENNEQDVVGAGPVSARGTDVGVLLEVVPAFPNSPLLPFPHTKTHPNSFVAVLDASP